MAETTNISKLIINYLTEEQYATTKASGLINENELYVTDVQDSTTLDCFEELFTATEGQTLFTLTEGTYQVGESRLTICVNGAQQPSTAYTETSSSSFTFDSGLSVGDSVIARYFNSRITSNITLQAHKSSHASAGNDALTPSDIGASASTHTHGNITNDGKIGSTADLMVCTTTAGAVTTKTIAQAQTLLGVSTPLYEKIRSISDTSAVGSLSIDISDINFTTYRTLKLIAQVKCASLVNLRYNSVTSYTNATMKVGESYDYSSKSGFCRTGDLSYFLDIDVDIIPQSSASVVGFAVNKFGYQGNMEIAVSECAYSAPSTINLVASTPTNTVYIQNASLWGVKL